MEEEAIASERDSMVPIETRFDESHADNEVEDLPEKSNSKRGTISKQLGKQLSCNWTTRAAKHQPLETPIPGLAATGNVSAGSLSANY
ncbi:hypothetical protein GQ457_08G002170 [Hibiscus cannabinus]